MKESRNHNMTQLVELQSKKKQVDIHPKVKSMLCADHDLEMNFFCETCDQLVCHYCTTNEHNGHVHNSVKKMANKHRKEMEKMAEPVEEMINKLCTSRQKVVDAGKKITSQATEVDQQIHLYYDELHRQLLQQREALKNKLRELSTKKKKAISLQLEQMDFIEARLLSVKELNDAVKNGSDQEALFMKKQVGDDVKRLTASYGKMETEPVELSIVEFIPTKKYQESFPLFGQFLDDVVIPGNCVVTDIPTQSFVGSKSNFTIITKNCNNGHCSKGGNHIVVQAQSSSGGDVVPVEVKDNNDGSYSASFITKQVGEVKLSITIEGDHIKGSPYTIVVHRDYKTVNKPRKIVNNSGNMGCPACIAFGKNGVWVVAGHINHSVYIFDSQDEVIKMFGQHGTGNSQFQHPWGVSFDANNDLYVTEYSNNRVQKFHVDGTYLLQFGSSGSSNGQLSGPSGVAVHNDKVFVADRNNHRVSVFHLNGQFNNIIGSGHLSNPYDVAVTANDRLLVADYANHCISRFTLDGTYVDKFGDGHLNNPVAVTTDLSGFILVGGFGNCRVPFFDKDGAFIHMFGSSDSAYIFGIAVSRNNDVYVADYNKRVQIF
ncbi:tripartite motif-containing protein 2-like [Dysidea avara]|uniref:tripartite motif-containing protein 2-like n=1 Tax=Dysidea avara TaxID=196820 RepID=UPI0033178C5E